MSFSHVTQPSHKSERLFVRDACARRTIQFRTSVCSSRTRHNPSSQIRTRLSRISSGTRRLTHDTTPSALYHTRASHCPTVYMSPFCSIIDFSYTPNYLSHPQSKFSPAVGPYQIAHVTCRSTFVSRMRITSTNGWQYNSCHNEIFIYNIYTVGLVLPLLSPTVTLKISKP